MNAIHCRTSISARMDCFSWDLEVGILTFKMSTRKTIPPGLNWWKAVHIDMTPKWGHTVPETPKGLAISMFFCRWAAATSSGGGSVMVQWVRVVSWEDQNVFRVQKCAESYTYYFSPPKMQVHKSERSKSVGHSFKPNLCNVLPAKHETMPGRVPQGPGRCPGWNFQGTRLLDPRAARDLSAFPNPPWLHGGFQGSRPRLLVLKDVLFSFRPEESCWWNLLELGGGRYSIPGAIPYPLFSVESDRGSLISEAQRIHVAKPALTLTHSCWFLALVVRSPEIVRGGCQALF